jgi:hypothetical protein
MASKWCFKCNTKINVHDQFCGECGSSSFVHQDPAELDKRIYQGTGEAPIFESEFQAEVRQQPQPITVKKPLQSNDENDLASLLRQSIKASNRTTHAVRAFVRFLFIQLSATTLAVFIYGLSMNTVNAQKCADYGDNCTPNGFLIFLAGMVWLGGVIWSSQAGWSELEKSNVPGA